MKWVERLARFMAILGGAVLIALIIIVTISVIGRGLNTFGHSAQHLWPRRRQTPLGHRGWADPRGF